MNRLDIEQVNRRSPYHVQAVSDMEYIFDTDFGVSYQVGFINDESIWETGAYQFISSMPTSNHHQTILN